MVEVDTKERSKKDDKWLKDNERVVDEKENFIVFILLINYVYLIIKYLFKNDMCSY